MNCARCTAWREESAAVRNELCTLHSPAGRVGGIVPEIVIVHEKSRKITNTLLTINNKRRIVGPTKKITYRKALIGKSTGEVQAQ